MMVALDAHLLDALKVRVLGHARRVNALLEEPAAQELAGGARALDAARAGAGADCWELIGAAGAVRGEGLGSGSDACGAGRSGQRGRHPRRGVIGGSDAAWGRD
jgi:hypothetical protein